MSSPTMHGEEMQFVQEAFDRNWVAPVGFNCDGFEAEMLKYLSAGSHYALALSSCTSALHLAVKLAGIRPGDVVLCSDLTFVASANPVAYEGGVQVFVDSERDTWNMDPLALEKAFRKYPQAKAVILVHLYGVPAKVVQIREICKKYNAVLIEDAAEALSATYCGRQCGTFGDYSTISFNGNKIITTSMGGMLITGNPEDREKALRWATQSREDVPWYLHREMGYNYRMSNITAGIGRGQLLHLEAHRSKKERIYRRYQEAFRNLPVRMNPYLEDSVPNFWLSCMLIEPECGLKPMDILEALEKENIEGRPIWMPMHLQPLFADRDFITVSEACVDEDIFARGICLPSDIKMTDADQERVIRVVRSCFGRKAHVRPVLEKSIGYSSFPDGPSCAAAVVASADGQQSHRSGWQPVFYPTASGKKRKIVQAGEVSVHAGSCG